MERVDVEHIEANFGLCVVHNDVENERYCGKSDKHRYRPSEEAFVKLMAVMRRKEDTERELEAVMYHRLNIDENERRKYRRRQNHDDKTGKQRKCSNIRHNRAAEFAILHQEDKREGVHRRGAELERESVPLIIKGNAFGVGEAVGFGVAVGLAVGFGVGDGATLVIIALTATGL